jgi:hypothetical protein
MKRQLKNTGLIVFSIAVWSSASIGQTPAAEAERRKALDAAKPTKVNAADPQPDDSYTVIYAGRLLGYYRYPEVQELASVMRTPAPGRPPFNPTVCEDHIADLADTDYKTPEAAKFREALQLALSESVGTTVRVAVGDDFAPFLLSRQMWDEANKQYVEKEDYSAVNGVWTPNDKLPDPQYQAILQGLGEPLPMDNVGCFMRLMRLDAMVPGEHEFYFGPTRLQNLARYLAPPNRPADAQPGQDYTRMLGANLYMQTNRLTPAASQVATPSARSSSTPHLPPAAKVKITAPKVALPWMRTVEIRNWDPSYRACIVRVDLLAGSHSPASLTVAQVAPNCQRTGNPATQISIPLNVTAEYDAARRVIGYKGKIESDTVLIQDVDYAVVAVNNSDTELEAWQPFTVVPPFFGFSPSSRQVSAADRPWVIKHDNERGKRVAIFGVVDPNLIQFIGRYNAAWLEWNGRVDDNYETDLQVSDPAEALKQAIEYCRATTDCDEKTRIVVLAQMPQQTAYAMAGSFRGLKDSLKDTNIDLIVAEADPVHGTGNRTTLRIDGNQDEFEDPVVVVPDPGADVPDDHRDQMAVKVQRAIVTPGDYHVAGNAPRVVRNQAIYVTDNNVPTNWFPKPADAMTPNPPPGAPTLLTHLQNQMWGKEHAVADIPQFAGPGPANPDEWQTGLQKLGLKAMQRYCKSDAAMLQLRDIFYVKAFTTLPLTKNGYEAVMDALYWKGDFVRCMNVAGTTIASALQRSQDLQQTQVYGLLADQSLTKDWSLATLGTNPAQPDPASAFRLVADRLLDPKKLYSVAVTDYLSNGDTGYPAFQGAEPPPDTPWSRTWLLTVVESIMGDPPKAKLALKALDTLSRVAGVPGNGPLPDSHLFHSDHMLADWVKAAVDGRDVKVDTGPTGRLERNVQQRPVWSFELYKLDFSYSMAAHSGLERTVPQLFPGVSAVDLTAADSSAIAFDEMFRVQHDHKSREWYVQSELNYGYRKTRQASKSITNANSPTCVAASTPGSPNPAISDSVGAGCGDPYAHSQTADFFYNEFGYAQRLRANTSPYGWKLQLPIAAQTQLKPSIALPEGFSGSMNAPSSIISSPRSVYLEGRPGFRWDFSYPKPSNWNLGQGGGGGGQSAGGQQGGSGGGGKGKKGGGGASSSSQNQGNGQNQNNSANGPGGAGGGGGAQTQTFDSFVEFGYEFGPSLNGPKEFKFYDPTPTGMATGWLTSPANPQNLTKSACAAQTQGNETIVAVADVVDCFFAASNAPATGSVFSQPYLLTPIIGGRSHFQDGMYFDYHLDVPAPFLVGRFTTLSNIEFVSDLRSDYLIGRAGDTPIDTHFLFDSKQSLNIPIFMLFSGKVSLAPSVEMIFFSNKISGNLYKSYSTSVSLSYTFERRTGLNWWKTVGYQNPVPTLPTLPSR